jgi:hypothetical protein
MELYLLFSSPPIQLGHHVPVTYLCISSAALRVKEVLRPPLLHVFFQRHRFDRPRHQRFNYFSWEGRPTSRAMTVDAMITLNCS